MFEIYLNKDSKRGHSYIINVKQILVLFILIAVSFFLFLGYRSFSAMRGRVLGQATSVMREFEAAQSEMSNLNWSGLREHFLNSSQILEDIEQELNQAGGLASILVKISPKGRNYYHLFTAAQNISQAGYILSSANLTVEDQTFAEKLKVFQD
ncbi:MAG: hypothetical protein ABH896_01135, partial [Candidatus Jacksonbacteria bacterium]